MDHKIFTLRIVSLDFRYKTKKNFKLLWRMFKFLCEVKTIGERDGKTSTTTTATLLCFTIFANRNSLWAVETVGSLGTRDEAHIIAEPRIRE